jgi:DNA repair exonuclease SbcCD ATPase subunit
MYIHALLVAAVLCPYSPLLLSPHPQDQPAQSAQEPQPKEQDPHRYAQQELPVALSLVDIESQLRSVRESRMTAKGTGGGVALDAENLGITPEATLELLEARRVKIQRQLDDLEEEAHRHGVSSGAIRAALRELENAPPPTAPPGAAETPEALEKAAVGQQKVLQQNPEKYWRTRFAQAYAKLRTAEKELDVLQREWARLQKQHYDDPNKALREQYTRQEINERAGLIEQKKREILRLKQDISDLEDDLRHFGGLPGWARPQ